MTGNSAAHSFQTTRWTQVVAARGTSPEAKEALRELCAAYYAPVELFVRRCCGGQADARDLTHEFFARVLEADGTSFGGADRTRGRFRTYLLGAVKHHLADDRDRRRALKRGGGRAIQSLDAPRDEADRGGPLEVADPDGFPPDAFFDRQWALAVLDQALAVLRAEAAEENELARFETLQRWLVTPQDGSAASAAAHSLEMTDAAFKVAVHRLRKRFRKLVVERIAVTVDDPAEVDEELAYLLAAVSASSAGAM
jgi:RNA polymerase sigma-70 factor (ECF subfamily)